MTAMSGINKITSSMEHARSLLLKIGSGVGRFLHGHTKNAGKGVRKTVDTVETADRKRLFDDDGYENLEQARLTLGEGALRPHRLVIADNNVFAATVHNKDWDLRQSKELIGRLDDWLAATDKTKRIIIVEGRVPDVPAGFRKVTEHLLRSTFASERGEGAAIVLKGKVAGVDVISGEENEGHQFAELLRNNRPEHVLGYYVLRQMPQALAAQEKNGIDMAAYLNDTIDRFAPHMPEGVDARQAFTELMAREYSQVGFTGVFRTADEPWLMHQTNDPGVNGVADTPVQQVALECNQRRDAHFAQLFQEKVDEGYAVFGQYGVIHYRDIKPNIAALDDGVEIRLNP